MSVVDAPEQRGTRRWTIEPNCIPRAVYCVKVGYPHLDEDGNQQFDNTHFDTEYEAWVKGEAEVVAGCRLADSTVEHIRADLARAIKEASDAHSEAADFMVAKKKYLERLAERRFGPLEDTEPDAAIKRFVAHMLDNWAEMSRSGGVPDLRAFLQESLGAVPSGEQVRMAYDYAQAYIQAVHNLEDYGTAEEVVAWKADLQGITEALRGLKTSEGESTP